MTLRRVDHTAIIVHDLDEALERYRRLYGVTARERTRVDSQRVDVAFLPIGDTQIELISPLDDSSGVARFLARRGEALHHIGVLVDDIAAELKRLEAEGVELIDRQPRPGVHGLIAFIHPRSSGGVLMELIEKREA